MIMVDWRVVRGMEAECIGEECLHEIFAGAAGGVMASRCGGLVEENVAAGWDVGSSCICIIVDGCVCGVDVELSRGSVPCGCQVVVVFGKEV